MKKRIVQLCSILMVSALVFGMAGCRKKTTETTDDKTETGATEKEEETEEAEEEPETAEEEIPANQNLLTGIADLTEGAIGKRPVAVMVNNVSAALPQYGIAAADIIFEIPVEGDLTRLMCLYADYTTLPQICPIRSCRAYFPALSEGFDAFYVHWGMDDTMSDYIDMLNLDRFDGMANTGGLYGRDQNRLNSGYSLEHTGYFDGTNFVSAVNTLGMRTDLEADKTGTAFNFNGLNEIIKADGSDCTAVNINFGAATATLTYDAATQTYLKQINGSPQMDSSTNTQLAFTNVFVLETDISVRDDIGHKEVDWSGSQDSSVGYYISAGGIQQIHWMKEPNNESSRLRFYDMNGNELSINRGKSYIAVNYRNQATFQ